MHEACYNGHPDVVEVLLDAGALGNFVDESGYTILHCAVISACEQTVKHVLNKAQVDYSAADENGDTALGFAIKEVLKNSPESNKYINIVALFVQFGCANFHDLPPELQSSPKLIEAHIQRLHVAVHVQKWLLEEGVPDDLIRLISQVSGECLHNSCKKLKELVADANPEDGMTESGAKGEDASKQIYPNSVTYALNYFRSAGKLSSQPEEGMEERPLAKRQKLPHPAPHR